MTRKFILLAAGAAIALTTGLALTAPARAQTGAVAQAMASGAEVDSINIKRRAAYTDLAAKRGVTVADVAAATGCQTLASRVKTGQAFRIGSGAWQTKGAGAIALPDYCATAGN